MHDFAVLDRLLLVRALVRKLGNVVARRKRFFAGTAEDHATQRVVRRQLLDRFAERRPHAARQRIQLVRSIEHDGRNCAVALDVNQVTHFAALIGLDVQVLDEFLILGELGFDEIRKLRRCGGTAELHALRNETGVDALDRPSLFSPRRRSC